MNSIAPQATGHVDGVATATYDRAISALLENPNEWGGPEYSVAIENDIGEVYRLVIVVGLANYVHLAEGLKRLGLVDRFFERPDATGRFDAHFATPQLAASMSKKSVAASLGARVSRANA